jgi:hypothetical protein
MNNLPRIFACALATIPPVYVAKVETTPFTPRIPVLTFQEFTPL